jgi:ADP-ribose pyrophosphatase YjhB (NUDIX family)
VFAGLVGVDPARLPGWLVSTRRVCRAGWCRPGASAARVWRHREPCPCSLRRRADEWPATWFGRSRRANQSCSRGPPGRARTQVPADGLDPDECVEEAALREVSEYSGLVRVCVVRRLTVSRRPYPQTGARQTTCVQMRYDGPADSCMTSWGREVDVGGHDAGLRFRCWFEALPLRFRSGGSAGECLHLDPVTRLRTGGSLRGGWDGSAGTRAAVGTGRRGLARRMGRVGGSDDARHRDRQRASSWSRWRVRPRTDPPRGAP